MATAMESVLRSKVDLALFAIQECELNGMAWRSGGFDHTRQLQQQACGGATVICPLEGRFDTTLGVKVG